MNTEKRPTYINNPEYLRDLLTLTTKQMRAKWRVGRTAVYIHQRMSGSEIRQRIKAVES